MAQSLKPNWNMPVTHEGRACTLREATWAVAEASKDDDHRVRWGLVVAYVASVTGIYYPYLAIDGSCNPRRIAGSRERQERAKAAAKVRPEPQPRPKPNGARREFIPANPAEAGVFDGENCRYCTKDDTCDKVSLCASGQWSQAPGGILSALRCASFVSIHRRAEA